jgi:DNA polymerase-3 subunit gamma/tau
MGQALYRAHRPKKLADVVGQEHITTALTRALKNGTISHAYLFTGPRGVGKTTIARILAHEINGLPYDDESIHLDIIEIDAASNRRIDEIRDLRDKVHIAPSAAKYKVYIIDEVHMLTKEAFNALLKTLEEPPAHVVFILATTEAHKLPETIISRTQRFGFKPVDLAKVTAHLRSIATSEKIGIDDAALQLIAAHGEGSFRDSISLLDQVRNTSDKVTLQDVQGTLGIAPKELIEELVQALGAHSAASVATSLRAVHTGGHEPSQVAKQLGEALREQIISGKPSLPTPVILQLLAKLLDVPSSADPKSYLEIALLDAALTGMDMPVITAAAPSAAAAPAAAPKVMKEVVAATPVISEPHPSSVLREAKKEAAAEKPVSEAPVAAEVPAPAPAPVAKPRKLGQVEEEEDDSAPTSGATLTMDDWAKILSGVKAKHNTIFSLVKASQPNFGEGSIQLICAYAFHQKKLNEKKNKQFLADIIQEATGQNVRIECIVGEPEVQQVMLKPQLPPADEQVHTVANTPAAAPAVASAAPAPNSTVEAVSNIFGGAELLES